MLHTINHAFTRLTDLLLLPLRSLPPFWGLFLLSLISSLIILLAYKLISSPKRIHRSKDLIKANILAIRLYKDNWRVIAASFGKSLLHTLRYLGLNLLPVAVALPLLVPFFTQMDVRYGMRPFAPGDQIVVKAKLSGDPEAMDVELLASEHVRPAMNPVFIKKLQEADWKLWAVKEGQTELQVRVNGRVYRKSLQIGGQNRALSNRILARSSLDHILYPVEPLLEPNSDLAAIEIAYPGRTITFLGLSTHWLVWFLILTLIIVLGLKNRFGVEF